MDPSVETSASPSASASASHHDDNEDLDPAKFLKSIRELSERREREDLERFRKLEAEVEKSRAERARKKLEAVGAGATPAHVYSPGGVNQQQRSTPSRPSISPVKAHSAHEIHSPTSARNESFIHTPPQSQPLSPSIASPDLAMEANRAGPPSPTKDIPEFKGFSSGKASDIPSAISASAQTTDPASSRPSPSASSLARSGTLSWQQRRPQSRGASRPVSVVGSEESGHARNASRASRPTSGVGSEDSGHAGNASLDQPEPSRDQIAASLGSRDPSWFRQTAERGTGSAAYRKSKDEASAGQSVASSRRVLPGLARDTSDESSRRAGPAPAENFRAEVASTPSSARDSGIASSRVSATPSNSTLNKADLKSLLAEDDAQRQASPMSDQTSSTGAEQHVDLSRNLSMSSSQARLASAAERPSSPTKGMGGFVQSAMMKRSDSVSKRWSAQPGASLSRQNSTVSSRSGYNGLQGSRSMPRLEPTPSSREASNEPASRPTSSSSNVTALTQQRDADDVFVKPALPHHSRSKSVASTYGTTADDNAAASPPSNPSKRFSPTKSSWIENALTKPESPKPSTARNAQPGWMANIAKAKAERASAESTPRMGTPRPPGEAGSRPASPVKSASAPFGPSLLRSASSRSLAAGVRSSTPPLMRTPVAAPQEVPLTDEPTSSHLTEPSKIEAREASVPQVEPTPERQLSNARTLTAPQSEQTPERLPDATKTPTAPRSETQEYSALPITLEPRPAAAKPALELPSSRSFISPSPSTSTKPKPEILTKPKPETAPIPEHPLENAQTRTAPRSESHESSTRSITLPSGPTAAKPALELPSSRSIISPSPSAPTQSKPEVLTKSKPETPAKPQTDFRNTLRSRPAGETKPQGTPEFLSKFGQLRKTQPEKYVAPDILRDNITRGKADLARTGGPVKAPRRDELKESLLAKKEDWKKAKEEGRELPGQVHERKTSAGVPVTPPKPEALAKREWLGRSGDAGRAAGRPEKGREATPEALTRQRGETFREEQKPATPTQHASAFTKPEEREVQRPATPAKSLAFSMKPARAVQELPKSDVAQSTRTRHEPAESNVPNFSGFGSKTRAPPTPKPEDNKENSDETLSSVKSAASFWGRQPSPKKADAPPQILLPSQRDEEAAMRSAGLLASSHSGSSSRDGSSNGLGISVEKRGHGSQATPPGSAGLPPKPMRSSRTVSGQLMEASVNKGASRLMPVARPSTEAERLLARTFGAVPTSDVPLMIDTRALMSEEQGRPATEVKTLRRTTQEILPDGSVITLRQQEQYTLFDSSVYICTHTYLTATSTKQAQLFIWSGSAASHSALSHAQKAAKTKSSTLPLQTITQGHEPALFLQALGGIVITRRGSRLHTAKQYILCGRQHLGHIVLDEVDFGLDSLCAGFVFLISYPVTLQRTDLYLWKGTSCAMEEVCAARLVGMEVGEMGGIVEVEQGNEGSGLLGMFGPETVKKGIPEASAMWKRKAEAPGRPEVRLYRVEEVVQKVGLFAGLLSRRPSWNSRPPPSSRSASQDGADIKVEAKRLSSFTQTDLEAEGIYVLDAYSELYVLIGPLFASVPERVRGVLLAQTLRFTEELARFHAENEGWEGSGRGFVLFGGVPKDVKMLFRCWDQGRGLWGTAGLMAGSRGTRGDEVMMVGLDEVVRAVCR
ncbi:hypothetical protein LTR12_015254 [Friedmanniomyces endolithicus]|nr:hypothetical protein LTR12_015254 [Friedmanniomyces endolithicus]